jgi:two-component system nitrogen regulation response regulator GlnG
VRVIAATHQNLEERVRKGLFREDLFHRLNVIRLRLPALRERVEDVPLLARHFLQRSARELGVEPKRLTEGAHAALARFAWPGNVRQLENVCHWLTVMAPTQSVDVEDLPPEIRAEVGPPIPAAAVPAQAATAGAAHAFSPGSSGLGGGFPTLMPAASVAPEPAPPGAYALAGSNGSAGSTGLTGTGGLMSPVGARADAQAAASGRWASLLEREVSALLAAQVEQAIDGLGEGHSDLMDRLTREFESAVIRTALRHTRGRRIDAAQRLGIGRNTITRKIQDLHLEDDAR